MILEERVSKAKQRIVESFMDIACDYLKLYNLFTLANIVILFIQNTERETWQIRVR